MRTEISHFQSDAPREPGACFLYEVRFSAPCRPKALHIHTGGWALTSLVRGTEEQLRGEMVLPGEDHIFFVFPQLPYGSYFRFALTRVGATRAACSGTLICERADGRYPQEFAPSTPLPGCESAADKARLARAACTVLEGIFPMSNAHELPEPILGALQRDLIFAARELLVTAVELNHPRRVKRSEALVALSHELADQGLPMELIRRVEEAWEL